MTKPQVSKHRPVKELIEDWDATAGLTIASVAEESTGDGTYTVIRFTDGRAVVLRHYDDWFDLTPATLKSGYYFDRAPRVFFGLDSLELYMQREAAETASYRAQEEAKERRKYEALKKKFG
jgi:hypothetical protein